MRPSKLPPVARVLAASLILASTLAACRPAARGPSSSSEAPVLYVSLDEPYVRPVVEAYRRDTGIAIHPVYDTEANKSRGLAQRILAERSYPRADVFWSSEVMQTLSLADAGVLAPYRPATAEDIPARYRDPRDLWTGFAARFRVLLCYQPKVKDPPRSLLDLTDPRWRDEVAMANPLFGSTMTEAAALFQVLGPERAKAYYRARQANGTRIVDGNSVAAEQAARGDVLVGQTDEDDAYIRVDAHLPVRIVFPGQDGMGALMIPNTASLVKGGPHPEAGKRFLDFLLRPETELMLANAPSRQLPLHASLQSRLPPRVRPLARLKRMAVDYARLTSSYREVDAFLREVFLR